MRDYYIPVSLLRMRFKTRWPSLRVILSHRTVPVFVAAARRSSPQFLANTSKRQFDGNIVNYTVDKSVTIFMFSVTASCLKTRQ